ncbi:uncharacterized protein A4U43_C04F13420 [Asparagus officinalis]|uniref:Secreted protein n=1 Tax=Asparagus officinalis TaxID=4686 RepID=A0A5P1F592_ASPOF|nr:uncharacterized protein A4U43_C04F13420 [Asparagus officinalis]
MIFLISKMLTKLILAFNCATNTSTSSAQGLSQENLVRIFADLRLFRFVPRGHSSRNFFFSLTSLIMLDILDIRDKYIILDTFYCEILSNHCVCICFDSNIVY